MGVGGPWPFGNSVLLDFLGSSLGLEEAQPARADVATEVKLLGGKEGRATLSSLPPGRAILLSVLYSQTSALCRNSPLHKANGFSVRSKPFTTPTPRWAATPGPRSSPSGSLAGWSAQDALGLLRLQTLTVWNLCSAF